MLYQPPSSFVGLFDWVGIAQPQCLLDHTPKTSPGPASARSICFRAAGPEIIRRPLPLRQLVSPNPDADGWTETKRQLRTQAKLLKLGLGNVDQACEVAAFDDRWKQVPTGAALMLFPLPPTHAALFEQSL
jgi:hypothetical protein